MLRFKFSDTDWTDIDGKVLKMSLENDYLTDSRLTHNYQAPVITEDSWNGDTYPVQINIWDSYIIKIHARELAINMLPKMISCKNLTIEDFSTGELLNIDTQSAGALTLEPGDRNDIIGQGFNLICRSRKIKIYPGISVNNTNVLRITENLIDYNYYTDKEIISFITDSERSRLQSSSGLDETAMTLSKNGRRMVFYLMESDAILLKKRIENIGYSSMIINPSTNNIQIAEIGKCTLTPLTEGLYRCEAELITNSNRMYA